MIHTAGFQLIPMIEHKAIKGSVIHLAIHSEDKTGYVHTSVRYDGGHDRLRSRLMHVGQAAKSPHGTGKIMNNRRTVMAVRIVCQTSLPRFAR